MQLDNDLGIKRVFGYKPLIIKRRRMDRLTKHFVTNRVTIASFVLIALHKNVKEREKHFFNKLPEGYEISRSDIMKSILSF